MQRPVVSDFNAIKKKIMIIPFAINHPDLSLYILHIYKQLVLNQHINEHINAQLVLASHTHVQCRIPHDYIEMFETYEFYDDMLFARADCERICRKKQISLDYVMVNSAFTINVMNCSCNGDSKINKFILDYDRSRVFLELLMGHNFDQYVDDGDGESLLFFNDAYLLSIIIES